MLLAVISRGHMGAGDIKLAGVIGLMLGFPAVLAALFLGEVSRTRWYAGSRSKPAYTGFGFTYQPVFAPGLYLGAGRTYMEALGAAGAWLATPRAGLRNGWPSVWLGTVVPLSENWTSEAAMVPEKAIGL